MVALLSGSLDPILKDFYAGPIADTLNREIEMVDMFNKSKISWVGRKGIMSVRTGRNGGRGFVAENGALPTAGQNQYADLVFEAKYLYGRTEITGPAIAQAKASAGAFVNALKEELDGAIETVKDDANATMFFGGGTVGFLNQRQAQAGAANWEFSGNYSEIPANGFPVACKIVRCDTYDEVGAATTVERALPATATPGTVLIGGALDTSGVADGVACAIVVINDTAGDPTLNQAMGIYGNLAAGTYANPTQHFTAERDTTLPAGIESLHSTILTAATGVGTRAAITTQRIQAMLDEIASESGTSPDMLYCNYIFRQEYAELMNANLRVDARDGKKSGDPGFDMGQLSFNGLPLKASRHCGKGLLVALNRKSWNLVEVQSPGLADLDGSVLSRSANTDSYEAFVRWYYNLICKQPNRNGIICGINFSGA
jgi:hypothetical protein